MVTPTYCRHCRRRIVTEYRAVRWLHYGTGSIWCDLGANAKAQP